MGPEVRIRGTLIDPEGVHLIEQISSTEIEQDVGDVDRGVVARSVTVRVVSAVAVVRPQSMTGGGGQLIIDKSARSLCFTYTVQEC